MKLLGREGQIAHAPFIYSYGFIHTLKFLERVEQVTYAPLIHTGAGRSASDAAKLKGTYPSIYSYAQRLQPSATSARAAPFAHSFIHTRIGSSQRCQPLTHSLALRYPPPLVVVVVVVAV